MADENTQLERNRRVARDPELERAKVWWQEHGLAIVAGIAIGLSAVVGFNYWQNYQQTRAESASVLFEQLRSATASAAVAEFEIDALDDAVDDSETGDTEVENTTDAQTEISATAATTATIERLADELMSEYKATPYAVHAAFALAKFAMDNDDFDQASMTLQWILDNGDDDNLIHIARLRLALVWLAKEDADSVVTLLNVAETAGFAARYHELTGDAHLQQGDIEAARSAYQRSLDGLLLNADERALLNLKLANLGN